MKPVGMKNEPAAADAAKTKNVNKKRKAAEVALPFSKLQVSKWNRSFDAEPDEAYVDELMKDIKRNGLIHQLTLVKSGTDDASYAILAGANRYWAMRKLRGDESGLREGEYIVRTDVQGDDPRCLDISLSENGHRRQSSVIETARYVDRLLEQEHVDQSKLARKLHLRREVVNRYPKLVRSFDQLPESWKKDLSLSPDGTEKTRPVITASHWVEVAGAVEDGEITPEVKAIMEDAAKDRRSTRDLRNALKQAQPKDDGETSPQEPATTTDAEDGANGDQSQSSQGTVDPRNLVGRALKAIQAAVVATKESMPDQAKLLGQAAKKVAGVLKQIEAAEKDNAASEEKTDTAKAA